MKVLVVIDSLGFGGAEMLVADFVEGASGIGVEVEVAYLKDRDGNAAAARLRELGHDPIAVGITGLLSPASVRAMREVVRRTNPDVVHTHLNYADLIGGLAARREGVPSVSTVHEMQWTPSTVRDRVKLALFARARRHLAGVVVAVSDAGRLAYLARGWDKADHVETVRNGVVDCHATRPTEQLRSELGLGAEDIVVAMVSVLRRGKGHELAFDVVGRLTSANPTLRLLVVGDGPQRAALQSAASSLGDRVVFAGHRDDVPDVVAACDVLLHPSDFDAYPTTLLEAMRAGRPVVASAVGGIPEIVDDGLTGLLVPPGDVEAFADAVTQLARDTKRRRALGDAGRAKFESSFEAGAWAARVRKIYESVLSSRSRRNIDPGAAVARAAASSRQSAEAGPKDSRSPNNDS